MSSSPEQSYNRLDGTDSVATRPQLHSLDTGSFDRPFPRNFYETKHSSTYVPHNRLSRYVTALTNLVPIRFKRVPGSELPLDKIGLFSSISFSWLNEYISSGYKNGMKDKSLPTAAPQDSCKVNGPRLDGLWHAHVVDCGQAGASVPRIAWKFVRTRVLVASFIYMLGMLLSLLSPTIILHQIVSAVEEKNFLYNSTTNNETNFMTTALPINTTPLNSTTNALLPTVDVAITPKFTLTTTTLSPLARKLTNSPPETSVNTSFGGKLLKELPDSIIRIIIVDEVIIFSHVGILVIVELVSYFLIAWSAALNLRTASRLRSACLALVYKKIIRSSIRYTPSTHQTITYFVPDSETLYELITNGPLIFIGPLILLLTSMFMWYLMGHWALIGIAVLITLYLCLILTAYLTKVFATKTMEYSLNRMSLMEELVNNIYLAKVTSWDRHFRNKIKDIRSKELAEMQLGAFSEGWSLSMVHLIPIITMCVTTMASLLTKKYIVSIYYIPVLVLLLINLKHCIRSSWLAMSSISRGLASLNKLKNILILKEADRYPDKPIDRNLAITINHGCFTWEKSKLLSKKAAKRSSQFYIENHEGIPVRFNVMKPSDTLSDINFYAPKAKLIGICGQPNTGKTSLLLAILGHLHHISGHVSMDGSCAYFPEIPWLLDGTLKENILFGDVFDSSRYYKAIRASSLNNDIATLPASDDTEITYIDLSMAQKQRIALARAVYMQRDINLLDNPLADVNINEGKEIFDKCVMHALGSKTIIMISDKVQFLNRCDIIYVMREGRIVEQGTHEELLQWNSEYTQLVNSYMKKYQKKQYRDNDQITLSSMQLMTSAIPRGLLTSTSTNASLDSTFDDIDDAVPLKQQRLREFPIKYSTQDRKTQIEYSIYVKYAGGWYLGIFICFLSICCSFFIAVAPLCFTYIAQKTINDNVQITIIFAVIIGSSIVLGLILMVIYTKTIFNAARVLHKYWLDTLCKANVSFFSITLVSVLLNIYSLNLHEVDSVLPRSMITVLMHLGISVFSIIILGLISSWLLMPVALFITISILYSVYVRGIILSLYEVNVNSIVPMYNHTLNTVTGRAVIQASRKERDFGKKFYTYCDNSSTFNFMQYSIKLWLEYRIKMFSALTLGIIILMCVSLTAIRDRFELIGLAFICTLQLAMSIVHLIGAVTSVYATFMALTCLDYYMKNIPKERPGTKSLPANWPTDGGIRFDNVLFPKDSSDNFNRESLTLIIVPGEKVAIIGNDSKSKISLVSALYRFIEISEGTIYVGNTNIAEVPLDKLRQSLCFIPDNPLLFSGSIKYNLDPAGKEMDNALMAALQRVFLWEKVSKLPDNLETDVRNIFTTSERKLLFLARAILNKACKIIIMEESVEDISQSAEIIEIVLRDVFAGHTIIALSNHKVRYCKRMYVLNDGKISEVSHRKLSLSEYSIAPSDVFTAIPGKDVFETSF